MSETKFVALSTQKGGAGKTTLTVLMASYLHYVRGIDVAVIDCDFPQYSIHSNYAGVWAIQQKTRKAHQTI